MTIPRYLAMIQEWEYNPPAIMLIRCLAVSWGGYEPKERHRKNSGQVLYSDDYQN